MPKVGCLTLTKEQAGRRDFLKAGSLGFLGLHLSQFLAAQSAMAATVSQPKPKAQACILMWLEGGPSHIDTWDPKPSSSFKPIATDVPGVQISELLPQLAKQMNKLAIVRTMRSKGNDHPQGTHYAVTGHEINAAMTFPSIGSIIAKEAEARNRMPPNVLIPRWENSRQYEDYFRAAFLGSDYDPMCIPDPSKKDFGVADLSLPKSVSEQAVQDRRAFLEVVDRRYRGLTYVAEHASMDRFRAQALQMLLTPTVRDAFDLSKESEKMRDRYGRDAVGQSALLARRLVEAGTRFVTTAGYHANSWDTHSANDKGHRDRLAPTLDRTLTALLGDLDERGLLDSTIVLAMGEFGRTPELNPALGRDHWPNCYSLVIGGGGIRGGQVIGASDKGGFNPVGPVYSVGNIFATIYKAFGIDCQKEYMSPAGRPIKIANALDDHAGEPLKELL